MASLMDQVFGDCTPGQVNVFFSTGQVDGNCTPGQVDAGADFDRRQSCKGAVTDRRQQVDAAERTEPHRHHGGDTHAASVMAVGLVALFSVYSFACVVPSNLLTRLVVPVMMNSVMFCRISCSSWAPVPAAFVPRYDSVKTVVQNCDTDGGACPLA